MPLIRKTPLRKVSVKKAERKRVGVDAVQMASEFTPKPRKKLKPRSPKNKGGQVALFKKVWDSRPHQCEVCGATILQPAPWNFSHLLPKGTYPDFKLREDNIVIKCRRCHDVWHETDIHDLMFARNWADICDRYFDLKREANGLKA